MFSSKDPRVKTTITTLRIREDTAKYLRNLDPNSAPYDGKSRMMKENPNPNVPEDQQTFKGDNYIRMTGDYVKLMNQEGFMIDSSQLGGVDLNNLAMPSQVEQAYKEFQDKKQKVLEKRQQEVRAKYGGEEEGEKEQMLAREIWENLQAQKEDQDEIQRTGREGKGKVQQFEQKGLLGIKSKFEEDLYSFGHSSVWGSYWHVHFGWGYSCCYGSIKTMPCKGVGGRKEAIAREYEWEAKEKKIKEDALGLNILTELPNKFGLIEKKEEIEEDLKDH